MFLMIVDGHTHIFSEAVIGHVASKKQMVEELRLDVRNAQKRFTSAALEREARMAGVNACVLLPVATVDGVMEANRSAQAVAQRTDLVHAAGSLHPSYPKNRQILVQLKSKGIRCIKLCTFSQGFDLASSEALELFDLIRTINEEEDARFFVLLDTFYKAGHFFAKPGETVTTPTRLGSLVEAYPEIGFVAAHMGGLLAPFEEIFRHLNPRKNLYLDTSNAAHTLREEEFVKLLTVHGPDRILFGTDWPWFGPGEELERIDRLCSLAGYDQRDRAKVFGGNAAALFGIGGAGI
jgi:predicted TIM-barrel fold metal-dependent hydrolase